MTRVKLGMGMVVVGLMLATGAPTAQPVARDGCLTCQVSFQLGGDPEGSWLIASSGDGATLSKRVSRSGLSISLSAVGDSVDVTAASTGTVTLARRGVVITVEPNDVLADHAEGVSRLLGESAAIEGLGRMVQAVLTSKRPEAMSVLATFALLRSLQGDTTGNTLLAQATERRRAVSLVPASQPSRSGNTVDDCWAEYERTLDRNYDRYSRCLRDYWWNQPVQYACGLEFAMVAELALFHVIACSGGFPVGG
jgi:hypothetical protein